MGRSFLSVRMGVKDIAGRWERAARAIRCDEAVYAGRVVKMAKKYASEAFYAFDDPLEAVLFSVLICMQKEYETDDRNAMPGDIAHSPEMPPCDPTGTPARWQGNDRV